MQGNSLARLSAILLNYICRRKVKIPQRGCRLFMKARYVGSSRSLELANLTWPDIKRKIRIKNALLVIPTGSTEQHGPHLPLGTDTYLAQEVARGAAERVPRRLNVLLTPPLHFGYSTHHLDFPGTLSVTGTIFIQTCVELCLDAVKHGFRRILLLNGHGGNHAALQVAARSVRDSARALVVVANYWDFAAGKISEIRESGPGGMAHACEFETSLMLFLKPETVRMSRAIREIPSHQTQYISRDMFARGTVQVAENWSDVSKSGIWGDPTVATKEKGEKLYDVLVDELSKFLVDFSRWEIGRL